MKPQNIKSRNQKLATRACTPRSISPTKISAPLTTTCSTTSLQCMMHNGSPIFKIEKWKRTKKLTLATNCQKTPKNEDFVKGTPMDFYQKYQKMKIS